MVDKRRKRRVNITLDPNVHDYIKKECDKNGLNFSQWVTMQIYEYRRKQDAKLSYVYHRGQKLS